MRRILYTTISVFSLIHSIWSQSDIPNNDKVIIINESTVNTKSLEYSPTFFENGIVFISSDPKKAKKAFDFRQGKKASTIMISRRGPEGTLNVPEVFAKEITSSLNDGPVSFDRTNETIFFSTNNQMKNGKKIKAKDGLVKQKIQTAKLMGGIWSEIRDLSFNDIEYVYIHPSISVDGNFLYFASNMDGGYGGMDIFVCKKEGAVWGAPENLGPNVNSAKNEVFPYIHPDGTLYFACDGKNTMGGLDIFSTVMKNEEFQEATNIGKPFNSENDDFGFILDLERKNGYFTSNRGGGKGEDDIYSFTSPDKIGTEAELNQEKPIVFFINDNTDGMDIKDSNIKIYPLSEYEIGDQVTDNEGNIIKLTSTDSTNILTTIANSEGIPITYSSEGKITANLKNGDYFINLSRDGYKTKQTIVNINDDRAEMMLLMEKVSDNSVPVTAVLKNNRGVPISNATITIVEENSSEPQVIKTDNFGKYTYNVKPNTNYSISATKDNHLSASSRFNSGNDPQASVDVPLSMEMAEITTPLPTGRIFQLNNVYYNYNDATLRPDAKKDLDPLVSLLKTYPEVEIELSSHTDSRGKSEYNQELSQRRAESVVKYLTDRGIEINRVKAVGYGESKLRNQCKDGVACKDAEHQINRRTEVKVTKGGNDLDESVIEKLYGKGQNDFASNENTDSKNASSIPAKGQKADGNTSPSTGKPTKADNKITTSDEEDENGMMEPATDGKSLPARTTVKKTYSGDFWVVAGSFQKESNAINQLARLKAKGFENTEIRYAEDIMFHRVVVNVSNNLKESLVIYKKVKAARIPAFILRD